MEVSWKNTRLGYGETVENLWNICGKTDMEKLCRLDTLENYRLENTKDAIQWSSTRTKRKD